MIRPIALGQAELVEGELTIPVELLLGWHPGRRLEVVDLDRAVGSPHDPVDDSLDAILLFVVEGEEHALLESQGLVAVEGVEAPVVVGQATLTDQSIMLGVVFGADDADASRVVMFVPPAAKAFQHPAQRRNLAVTRELIEALQHLVHPLSHEALDPFGVGGELQDVAVFELLRTALEARESRVAVDLAGHGPPSIGRLRPGSTDSAFGRLAGNRGGRSASYGSNATLPQAPGAHRAPWGSDSVTR